MGKTVEKKKKVVLLKESSIAEIQTLLEEEAKMGWFFVEKKGFVYYFEKRKKKTVKFRLLPSEEKLTKKEIDRYKEDGWVYVDNISKTAIFYAEMSADEIKIQPKKTKEMVKKMQVEIKIQIGFIFVISLFACISWVAVTFSKGYFWKNMMDNWNSNFSIPLVYLSLIIISCMLLVDKIDIYRAFNNVPICKRGNYKRKKGLFVFRSIMTLGISLTAVIVFIMTMASMLNGVNSRDCLKYKGKTLISLMDVEEINEFYTQKQYDNLGVVQSVNTVPIYEGVYSVSNTLLCNEHLEWEETLECEVEKYSAYIKGEYYNLKKEKIAKKVYREIIDKIEEDVINNKKYMSEIVKRKYKDYKYDEMFVRLIAGNYVVVIREGNEIYNIKFNGNNDYKKVLEYIQSSFIKRKLKMP